MTDADRERFMRALLTVGEVFGETLTSEARNEAYFRMLSDYDIAEVEAMMLGAMRSCRFFPKPAELIEQLGGSPADRAEEAWRVLEGAFVYVGQYSSVRFTDRALGEAVVAVWGGWIEANDDYHILEEPAWIAKRKEFLSAYRAADRRRSTLPDRVLPGRHEHGNRATGFLEAASGQHARPALIGESVRKALAP